MIPRVMPEIASMYSTKMKVSFLVQSFILLGSEGLTKQDEKVATKAKTMQILAKLSELDSTSKRSISDPGMAHQSQ